MYLEDVCVRYYRAACLAVSPFAIITCDYGINDSLRGRFCPATRHPTVPAARRDPPCLLLPSSLSGEHGHGGHHVRVCVCSCVRMRVSVVSLVFCNHDTHTRVQAMPALVPFVEALPFGTAPGGAIFPSRRQQPAPPPPTRELVSSWVPSPPWWSWQC